MRRLGALLVVMVFALQGCVIRSGGGSSDDGGSGGDGDGTGEAHHYPDGGWCGDGVVQQKYEICDHGGTRSEGAIEWKCIDECQTEVGEVALPDAPEGWKGRSAVRVLPGKDALYVAINEKRDEGYETAALAGWDGSAWSQLEVGPRIDVGYDHLSSLAMSPDGRIYVAGSTTGVLDSDIDPEDKIHTYDGFAEWTADLSQWDGLFQFFAVSLESKILSLVTLADGDIVAAGWVTGDINGSGDPSERPYAYVRRMHGDGSEVWTSYQDVLDPSGASIFGTFFSDLAVDESRDVVYALGKFDGPIVAGTQAFGRYDIVLAAYSLSDGTLQWAVNLGTEKKDVPGGLVVDPDSGDVFVAGTSDEAPWRIYLARVSPDGNVKWEKVYGTSSDTYQAYDIDLDSHGTLYVVGVTDDDFPFVDDPLSHKEEIGLNDAYLWVLDPKDGSHLWLDVFNLGGVDYCAAVDVSVDRNTDTIYVAGWCRDDVEEDNTVAFVRTYRLFWEE